MAARRRLTTPLLLLLLILSAIPLSIILSLSLSKTPATHVLRYASAGWLRECAKWDDLGRRFIVSAFEGGISEINVPDDGDDDVALEEVRVVRDADVAGNASLGLVIDRTRNRVLVAHGDVFGNRFSALAAYDLSTWTRLFLTHLSGPGNLDI